MHVRYAFIAQLCSRLIFGLCVCDGKIVDLFAFVFFPLTQIQFTILVVHFGHGFIIPGYECGYPKILSFFGVTQNLFMIALFSDFYRKTYGSKRPKKLQSD